MYVIDVVSELYSSANISGSTGTELVLLSLVFAQKSSQQSVFSHVARTFITGFLNIISVPVLITPAAVVNDNSCCLFTLHVGQWIDVVLHRSIGHLSLGGECPLVGGDSGDSPLMRGLSRGSCWGRGATDSSVLPWFSWSTWKESSALIETRHWIDMLSIDPTSTLILLIN